MIKQLKRESKVPIRSPIKSSVKGPIRVPIRAPLRDHSRDHAKKDPPKNFIYSKAFMMKCKELTICSVCPEEIFMLEINIENVSLPTELKIDTKVDLDKRKWIKGRGQAPVQVSKPWANIPPDVKRITGILNKLSEENCDKMIQEAKTFNHTDPEVISFIFKKILTEPFFSDLYAKFCESLETLHDLINEYCIIEFKKTNNKNLGKFIGELYKLKLITNLDIFLKVLTDDINESKFETLCKMIMTVGATDKIFKKSIEYLDSIRMQFSPRYRFMILNIKEGKAFAC